MLRMVWGTGKWMSVIIKFGAAAAKVVEASLAQ